MLHGDLEPLYMSRWKNSVVPNAEELGLTTSTDCKICETAQTKGFI